MSTKPQPVFRVAAIIGHEKRELEAIEYDGGYWIVAKWSEPQPEGWRKPLRLICADTLGMHLATERAGQMGFLLSDPLPITLFDDHVPPKTRVAFHIVDQPPLDSVYLPGLH